MNRGTRLGISSRQSERSTGRSQLDPTELKRDYNFLSGKLHGDITFSRGSNATLVGSDGLIKYAPHNLLPRSNEFTNSAWSNYANMTANRAISPTGENNASEITTESAIYDSVGGVGGNITISIHAKKNTASHFILSGGYPSSNRVVFDLETGVACQVVGVAKHTSESLGNGWFRFSVSLPSSSTDYIQFSARSSCTYASNNRVPGVYVYGAQVESTFDLDSGPQAYIETTGAASFGARFDHDHAASLSTDITESNARGLLIEEARTNLQPNSNQWVVATHAINNFNAVTNNFAISPTGQRDAWRAECYDTGGAARHEFYTRYNKANSTQYTHSLYIKPFGTVTHLKGSDEGSASRGVCFDLVNCQVVEQNMTNQGATIEDVGNGWRRVSFTFTSVAATADSFLYWAVGDEGSLVSGSSIFANYNPGKGQGVYVWGVQSEACTGGAYASSILPTWGSTSTRAADVATVESTAFNKFYKQGTGGAWIVDSTELAEDRTTQTSPFLVYESGGSKLRVGPKVGGGATNAIAVYYQDGGDMIYSAGALGTVTKGVKSKLGITFKTNDGAFTRDGKTPNTDSSIANIYSPTEVRLGGNGAGTTVFCGHIARLRYSIQEFQTTSYRKKQAQTFY